VNLLDHGYLNYIEHWGSDERIVESARQSTDGAFRGWGTPEKPGDEKLLRFLYENKHLSPFEMAGATIEVQAPIFVFREWHRHRTQSYNELSARYTEIPELFYVPSMSRMMAAKQSAKNKQGSEEGLLEWEADHYIQTITKTSRDAFDAYRQMLKYDVSREVARLVLPVNTYSRMRASANLRNWLGFLSLRMDKAAQWEIRQYANALHATLKDKFPRTMELFDGR
jgi:thymidylate synthase (FAD)